MQSPFGPKVYPKSVLTNKHVIPTGTMSEPNYLLINNALLLLFLLSAFASSGSTLQ